eukprot:scaffold93165_cov63-Phaeocystis_antarctica.AAC.2
MSSKSRPAWPASGARAADWPRLAEVRGSLNHGLTLGGASGGPAGRRLCHLVFDIGVFLARTGAGMVTPRPEAQWSVCSCAIIRAAASAGRTHRNPK